MISPMRRQKRVQNEIRQIRREMRLSQKAFGELMGVCKKTIWKWEDGISNPLLRTTLLYVWWHGSIEAALIANRIIQVAFSD